MAKILIVDDSAFSRKMLRGILVAGGHEIIGEACDGAEASEKYKELLPDITTMDITMPNVDGITVLKNIKEDYPEAKVIMITALGSGEKIIEALNTGAANYITKPFDSGKIIDAIEAALE